MWHKMHFLIVFIYVMKAIVWYLTIAIYLELSWSESGESNSLDVLRDHNLFFRSHYYHMYNW